MVELLNVRAWALEAGFFKRTSPHILRAISNGNDLPNYLVSEPEKDITAKLSENISYEWDDKAKMRVYNVNDEHKLARISMVGVITKYGDLCSYGSKELAAMIQQANAAKSISGIVLEIDGPGGSVSGTTQLANAIRDSQKPVVAFVDGMAASAHYWIASQADQIVANEEEYTEVGSIGVLCMLVNEMEWLKKEGYEVKIMRAEQSKDKARLNSVEEWPEEEMNQLQLELNQMADDFKANVKKGRGNRLTTGSEDIFTGKMYDIDNAMELGMIDYQGNIIGAIELCADLSKSQTKNSIKV